MGSACSSAIGCSNGVCTCHEIDAVEIQSSELDCEKSKPGQPSYDRVTFIRWLGDRVFKEAEEKMYAWHNSS